MRRRVNWEAISETDWSSFQSLKVKKNQVGLEAEVGMSTKGEKDQSGRDLLAGHFSGLKRKFTGSAGMLSLFLFCVLWKR